MEFSKYKIFFGLAIVSLGLASCEKELDRLPFNSVDESVALETSTGVEAALIGAYSRVGDDNVLGGGMAVYSELLGTSNEINWSGTFQGYTQIFNKTIPKNNDFAQSTWTEAYEAINVTNNVLGALDKVLEAKREDIEGQAKFLRAAVYFDLIRLYAKAWNDGSPSANDGVPIVLTPTREVTEANKVLRSKVSEVYAQIISDLEDAKSLLSPDASIYANSTAAAAMLARVYLQQGEYALATENATAAIDAGEYELADSYADAFPVDYSNSTKLVPNTPEDVFAMQVTNSTGYNDFNTYFSPLGRGDIDVNPSYFASYEADDDRLSVYYDDGGSIYVGKFDMVYGNVHILRLAEAYLIRAESNFRLGTDLDIALDDINLIRGRAGLPALAQGELTLSAILLERSHELAFEGHKIHDIKRLEGSVGSIPWNSPKLVFPIPERETKINTGLTQNDGY